jgi:molybdopterin/thiamine biosynthesis adenylyltransferase
VTLSERSEERYRRHLIIPELGAAGQEKLKTASVLVVGAGGLGSPTLYYLAGAGVGRLGVLDHDVVELSNLHRQPLHNTADVGAAKTASAAAKLRALNPEIEVVEHRTGFTPENAAAMIADYDVIVDAVDNFAARYLLNDACVLGGKTLVEAGILRFTGIAMTIRGGETTCYRCVFPQMPVDGLAPSGAQAGVFGPTPGVIGAVQAAEAIKVLVGFGRPLFDRLLTFDAADLSFTEVAVARDPACPVCGEQPTITTLEGWAAS